LVASRVNSLRRLEWGVGAYAVVLIAMSIVMFMMSHTSEKVGSLITAQNDAALKLWVNLDYFEHHRAKTELADTSLPPGLFESVVEFSRTNASILKTVHRLSLPKVFSPKSSLAEISKYVHPTDGRSPLPGKTVYFDHFGVDPRTDTSNVVEQGMYQIELYQAIRDYAQDESVFYKDCLGAVSVYVMPVLYALLGAFLWAFRSSCQRIRGPWDDERSPDRSSRFVMAAIAGIAISTLSTIFPKDMLLSPVAIAFVFGYSIEVFTSRLDSYIDRLTRQGSGKGSERVARS
jgi:hypothetical protein